LAFGRPASDEQVSLALAFLQPGEADFQARGGQVGDDQPSDDLWRQYMQVLLGSNEFMFVD